MINFFQFGVIIVPPPPHAHTVVVLLSVDVKSEAERSDLNTVCLKIIFLS